MGVVVVVSGVVGILFDARLHAAGRDDLRAAAGAGWVFVAAIVSSAIVGGALLLRRPGHPVGWLFAALACAVAVAGATQSYAAYGLLARPGSLPAAPAAAVVASAAFIVWLLILALICSLTPDGQYLSPRWRLASHVMVAAGTAWFCMHLFEPGPLESPFESITNPWALHAVYVRPVALVAAIVNNVFVIAAAVSLVVRYRRARDDVRRQLRWMAVVVVPFPLLLVVAFAASATGHEAVVNAAAAGFVVLLPIGAGLAVSQYHLYDVDRLLSRAITYLCVSALVVATYVAVVAAVARLVDQAVSRSPAAITAATLAAAAAARPIYLAVREVVDRRYQRRRYEALRQIHAFVDRPARHVDVQDILRAALDDPGLEVAYWEQERGVWITEHGQPARPGPGAVRVERAGDLVAAVTTGCDDAALARAAVDAAAPELDNARLRAAIAAQLEEVRASRERIAQAQIDERRRIERDLHDGAQQRLLGAAAQMQAALLNGSPDRMRAALEDGVAEARTAVTELRALANGLHPAALEDGGLAAAFDDLSARLPVRVVMDGAGRRYPPVVEATVWFAACEAVTNAVKHAEPTSIEVRLQDLGDTVQLVVVDDGQGGADQSGSGLRGLADRVEAAGGSVTIRSAPGEGTSVEAVVPCGL